MRSISPCDIDGICPYNSQSSSTCEYWCGVDADSDETPIYYDYYAERNWEEEP